MESRKMVLMKLFAGQQWRHRQRTDWWTWWRKERVGKLRESHGNIHHHT